MTVLATGEYQIQGTVNEQNLSALSEGQQVLIRSRVDETITWKGTVNKIDTESTVTSSSNSYSTDSDSTATSSKYNFYVTLDSMDGLILGQHVYIEPDEGQEEVKTGIWLYSYYLVMNDGDPYVWVSNSKNKLEKRTVELGEYDEDLDEYEIASGLTEDDMIAWPMEGLYEGVSTVTNAEDVDYTSPLYNQDSTEDGMMEGDTMMYDTEYTIDDSMMYDTENPAEDIEGGEDAVTIDEGTEVSE